MAEKEYIDLETAYDMDTLEDWYINSVSDNDTPVWTDEHLEELLNDFYVIPKDTPKADVEPVKHGHWIDNKHTDTAICSERKCVFSDETNYCPNCGSRMGGEIK